MARKVYRKNLFYGYIYYTYIVTKYYIASWIFFLLFIMFFYLILTFELNDRICAWMNKANVLRLKIS